MIYFIGNPINFTGIENATIEDLVEYFSNKTEIGFDTETTGFDPHTDKILSYQLGTREHQFVIDASLYPIGVIEDLLLDPRKEFLMHNAKFDLKFLYKNGIYPSRVWDTYLGEAVIFKGDRTEKKSLDATVKRYLGYNLDKSIRGKIFRERFSERVIIYCAEDVKFLSEIKRAQIAKLKSQDLMDSMSLENLFVKVLAYIEYSGIYIDTTLWNKKVEQDKISQQQSLTELNDWILKNNVLKYIDAQLDLFSDEKKTAINWSSPKQVAELFQHLGINTKVVDDKTGDLKDSVDASVLEKQRDKCDLIPIYLQHKKHEKILSTYGETVPDKINPATGRIHTQFTQILNTGRLSSGGKLGEDDTINLQNIPRMPDEADRIEGKIYERECFTHEEGNVLVNADYSGQEQVIFANWTMDKDLINFYDQQLGDMHSFVASKIFPYLNDVPLKTIKSEYKKERQIAKSAGFAINYGGDGSTIADNLNISQEEGEKIYQAYFKAFPGVSEYFKIVTEQALRNGYILFNDISRSKSYISNYDEYRRLERQVNHPGFWEKYREEKAINSILYQTDLKPTVSRYFKIKGNISRMALNFPIQGSAAEVTKLACIHIFEYIVKNNLMEVAKFSNVIHDEILLECPRAIAKIMSDVVAESMTKAGRLYCRIVPLKTDVKICEFWNH